MKQPLITLSAMLAVMSSMLFSCKKVDFTTMSAEPVEELQIPSRERDVNVTQAEAASLAELFLNSSDGICGTESKSGKKTSSKVSSKETFAEDGQVLMFIFNYEDGGFVIVGSTRNYYPILAYSDKGKFEIKKDMGPVDVWLDETKVCIKNSENQSDDVKCQMRSLWSWYEDAGLHADKTKAARVLTKSTGEDACWERIDSLQALYGSEGWTFNSLSNAEYYFEEWGFSNIYDQICYSALQNHSALNETVIGYKYIQNSGSQTGPLIGTEWYQEPPFGQLSPVKVAGCGAVAAGQVMFFYKEPSLMSWKDENFTWSDIPSAPTSSSKQKYLMRMLGQKFQMEYRPDSTAATTVSKIVVGLDSLGYPVYSANYNAITTRDTIIIGRKPVIMFGKDPTMDDGHFWVCEGYKVSLLNQLYFFSENQPYGAGVFTQGMYSLQNPGVDGGILYSYFYMNWGAWHPANESAPYNGWFLSNNVSIVEGNFTNNRKNIYVSQP